MSAVEGNDDEEATSIRNKRDADGDGLSAGPTGSVGMPVSPNCVVKEQDRKRRRIKAWQPRYGFFCRRKIARSKLSRSTRSAQDCRERRKVHYQCLEEMVLRHERANQSLRRELEMYKKLCVELDEGRVPKPLHLLVTNNDAD